MSEKTGKKIGRGSKLTPELQEQFCQYLREGHFLVTARKLVGISAQTFDQWKQKARAGEEPHASFMTAYNQAVAEGEKLHFDNIAKAAEKDWRASMFLIKQRHAARWGERELKVKAEVTHEVKDEVLEALAKIAAKKRKAGDE